ncbi:helix-turn-helix domain-containing protein [Halomicroarcula sp. GCM10025324]|uniref:helix-turn-helix domain-containing protein n=1 Tax=Haloarcula TaxID=2237 RepID=UPI0023E8BD48|nr:helix-turn-helix domain-containing protein [Halomicroarcula sp. ZS-22-S1]
MGTGIRAEVRVDPGETCLVAQAAARAEAHSRSIRRSVNDSDTDRTTVEFILEGGDPADDVDAELPERVAPVFDYGATTVYRYTREAGVRCPCDCVETYDCPIADRHTREGSVFLTFHAPDVETLQGLVTDLRESFPEVDIQRLLRSEGVRDDHDLVFVDRAKLTARQREALQRAHDLGYFDHPKRANAGDVAAAMGICRATFSEHLAAAQSKVLDALLVD